MNSKVEVKTRVSYGLSVNFGKLQRFIDTIRSAGRAELFGFVGSRVSELVRKHLVQKAAPTHHATADRLGANRTGFLEEGARRVVSNAGSDHAEVLIPVRGISRAFRDLTVTPKTANALTIPLDAVSYGRRASEVRALGWSIFRPKGKNVLMGTKDGETKTLYALVKSAHLRQDRSLLPEDEEISSTAKLSIKQYLQRRFAA